MSQWWFWYYSCVLLPVLILLHSFLLVEQYPTFKGYIDVFKIRHNFSTPSIYRTEIQVFHFFLFFTIDFIVFGFKLSFFLSSVSRFSNSWDCSLVMISSFVLSLLSEDSCGIWQFICLSFESTYQLRLCWIFSLSWTLSFKLLLIYSSLETLSFNPPPIKDSQVLFHEQCLYYPPSLLYIIMIHSHPAKCVWSSWIDCCSELILSDDKSRRFFSRVSLLEVFRNYFYHDRYFSTCCKRTIGCIGRKRSLMDERISRSLSFSSR